MSAIFSARHRRSRPQANHFGPLRSWLRTVGALGAGLALALAPSSPSSAASLALFVNGGTGHDVGSCPASAPCATITYALTQAAGGATIKVAAGTYPEQLVITKNVTIIGRSATRTVLAPTSVTQNDVFTDSTTPQFAIVDVHSGGGDLSSVNLQNLGINGAAAGLSSFNSCSDNFPGVYYHDAGGQMKNV